ncbi:MAG: hypothetical protein ABWY57_16030 [Mycetocola sp.]
MGELLSVHVDGIRFRGFADARTEGFYVGEDGLEGWEDGVDARRDAIPRPRGHGDFDLPSYLAPRDISLTGFCVARNIRELAWMRSRLMGLLAEGSATISVDYQGLTTSATVRRGLTRPSFDSVGGELVGTFALSFWAPDPRRYGQVNLAGPEVTSVAAYHYGNFAALPIIEVHGYNASGGYTIFGPNGKKFIVTQGLFGNDVHRIDMRTGKLTKNGVLQIGAVSRADLWTVPPGVTVAHKIVNESSAADTNIRVYTTDTYI